jgi:hypothetical protein
MDVDDAKTHLRAETAYFSINSDRSTVRFSAAKLPDAHELLTSGNSHYRNASLTAYSLLNSLSTKRL